MFERVDQDEETLGTVTSSGFQRNLHFIVIYCKIKLSQASHFLLNDSCISVQFNSCTVSQNFRTLVELQVARRAILQGHSSRRHVSTVLSKHRSIVAAGIILCDYLLNGTWQ